MSKYSNMTVEQIKKLGRVGKPNGVPKGKAPKRNWSFDKKLVVRGDVELKQTFIAKTSKAEFSAPTAQEAIDGVMKKGKHNKGVQVTLYLLNGLDGKPKLAGFTTTGVKLEHKAGYKAREKKAKRTPAPLLKGDPRLVACPKCKAPAGKTCVRENGKPQHNTHRARKDAAAEAEKKPNGKKPNGKPAAKSKTTRTRTKANAKPAPA